MICNETQRLLDAYVDNELDLRGALEVEEHLARCPACGAEEKSLRELQASARANLTRYPMPPGLEARLRAALHAEDVPAPAASTSAPPAPAARPPRRAWRWAALAPAAAAAALLIVAGPRLWPQPSEASVADAVVPSSPGSRASSIPPYR